MTRRAQAVQSAAIRMNEGFANWPYAWKQRDISQRDLRKTIINAVTQAFQGTAETFATQRSADSPLARLHFVVRTTPGLLPERQYRRTGSRHRACNVSMERPAAHGAWAALR